MPCSLELPFRCSERLARARWTWIHPTTQCLPRLILAAGVGQSVGPEGARLATAPARTGKDCQGTQVHCRGPEVQTQTETELLGSLVWSSGAGALPPSLACISFCDTLFGASPFHPPHPRLPSQQPPPCTRCILSLFIRSGRLICPPQTTGLLDPFVIVHRLMQRLENS